MTRAGTLSLAALCSCAIDARTVEVSPACVAPPPDGLISDFSTARLGRCWGGAPCPEVLASETTVSLGAGGVSGIVFPSGHPDSVVLALGLTGDLHVVRDETSALRIVMSYDSLGRKEPTGAGTFALELTPCAAVAGSGFTKISFRTDGSLGTCPLRFTALLRDGETATCSLDHCRAGPSTDVGSGVAAIPLLDAGGAVGAEIPGPPALVGMQWQFDLPTDGSRTCAADLTIDDLRLIP